MSTQSSGYGSDVTEQDLERDLDPTYDVVVVGGGAAGLNGALMLARARRSVVVLDAGEPRNAPSAGVHGLLGHEGTPPAELLERGRAEVRSYGGQVVTGEVVDAVRDGAVLRVELVDGPTVTGRRLLVTTGLVDELPEVPGLRALWGHDVLHCPYCHGWEVRDKAIGVLASGPASVHQALLFRQWSADVTFLAHTGRAPDGEEGEQLAARGIRVVTGEVTSLETSGDGRLAAARLDDGSQLPLDALVVAPYMRARAGFLAGLGLALMGHPTGMGECLEVDPAGRTSVEGVWAAGNVADLSAQVGTAAAAGAWTAAQVNMDLVQEETRQAVEAARAAGVAGG